MPWKELSVVDQRAALIDDWLDGHPVAALATAYGVSRKTAYKWIGRFRGGGRLGLENLDRTPHSSPHATKERIRDLVVKLREDRPRWGAPKIRAKLIELHPEETFPSDRTVHSILVKAGLVQKPKKGRRVHPRATTTLTQSQQPNDVWGLDFKGDFLLGNGKRCHPLTVTDHHTRYLIACQAFSSETFSAAQEALTTAFREFGLPSTIRSDNGRPFGSRGPAGLSRLSVWLIKLGITPEHIAPSRPDQNGRHERMHRTLKAETARPPRKCMESQQEAFELFRKDFNQERPHQALGQIPPARVYSPSPKGFPSTVNPPEYPAFHESRFVRTGGEISWKGSRVLIGAAFRGERVGLEEIDDGLWLVRFADWELGTISDRALERGLIPRLPSVNKEKPEDN